MDYLDRISELVLRKHTTKKQLLADLGLSKNTFVDWRTRGTVPSAEILLKIANYLDVSIDYLLTGSENKNMPDSGEGIRLSDDEFTILEYYRKLTPEEKAAFRLLLKPK